MHHPHPCRGGLNSADVANEEEGAPGEDGKPTKKRRICGVNTLEPWISVRARLLEFA